MYLRLKSAGKDQAFVRSAHRDVGYVLQVLGDHSLAAYSTVDAVKFQGWLIDHGMAKDHRVGVWQRQIDHQPRYQKARLRVPE